MGKIAMGAMGFVLGAGMMMMPAGRTVRQKLRAAKRWMKNKM